MFYIELIDFEPSLCFCSPPAKYDRTETFENKKTRACTKKDEHRSDPTEQNKDNAPQTYRTTAALKHNAPYISNIACLNISLLFLLLS
jgi:hypothetical protein